MSRKNIGILKIRALDNSSNCLTNYFRARIGYKAVTERDWEIFNVLDRREETLGKEARTLQNSNRAISYLCPTLHYGFICF